jgi:hypothetical protein
VERARSVLADLYPMIAELTGAPVIVDSSKHPAWAYLLAGTPGIDLRVVHLVRHPSGVVNSWSRPVARPHAAEGTGDQVIPTHSPVEVSIRWDLFNALFRRLAERVPTMVVRYEDYTEDTERALQACLALAGVAFDQRPALSTAGHGIAGNPSRFADLSSIRRDDQWVGQLSQSKHAMVSAMTWPIRRSYGYRFDRADPIGPFPVKWPAPGPHVNGTGPLRSSGAGGGS